MTRLPRMRFSAGRSRGRGRRGPGRGATGVVVAAGCTNGWAASSYDGGASRGIFWSSIACYKAVLWW